MLIFINTLLTTKPFFFGLAQSQAHRARYGLEHSDIQGFFLRFRGLGGESSGKEARVGQIFSPGTPLMSFLVWIIAEV
jgi:hypothetical protein